MSSKAKILYYSIVLPFYRMVWGISVLFVLSACSSGSGDSQSLDKNGSFQEENIKIAQAIYFNKRTPEGFYQEPSQGDDYYVTSHIKNIDLLPLANRNGQAVFELTSDDSTEALNWSEQATVLQTVYKQLVDVSETVLYRQFTRMDAASPEFVYLQRVLKANVLDRNGVTDDYKGRITLPAVNADDVKLIIEYLWTFTLSNNYGTAVLLSVISETDTAFSHVMQQAKLTASLNVSCDTIELYDVTYTVSKASGFINKKEVLNRVILAKRTGDNVEICPS